MKHFIILLALFSVVEVISAQEIKVTVVSEGAPLEYALLFINNKYYGASDSTGFVCIRSSDISAGDTISASYLGTDKGVAVYTSDTYGPEGIVITLIPNLHIEDIVVMANDKSEQMLRRYVKNRYTETWFMHYHGDYSTCQQGQNEIAGSFVYAKLPEVYARYYNLKPLEITSTSDTTGMSANIRKVISTATNASLFSVQLKQRYATTKNMKVQYMGKDNGCHVFLLIKPIYASILGSEDGFQAIIYADAKSGEIVSAKTTLIYSDGQIVELSANYATWKPKNTLGGNLIYPTSIDGSISHKDIKTHFLIEYIKISIPNIKPIPRKGR